MKVLHICNSFFERELELNAFKPLNAWLRSHPVVLQLQFLPLLYASPDDSIGVSDLPEDLSDPRLVLLDQAMGGYDRIEAWGPSLSIAEWAQEYKIPYTLPRWDLVREINSKAFSFTNSPKLPGAALLHNAREIKSWIAHTPGPKVLKTCYGTAGQGNFYTGGKMPSSLPLIGEPWVERTFDFSTQWNNGLLLGATPFENEPNGTYKCTRAGPEELLFKSYKWALEEHLEIARPLVNRIANLGYNGNLGIDVFVYRLNGRELLHPVVEINARKTMSWAALMIQQRRCPNTILEFSFSKNGPGLLYDASSGFVNFCAPSFEDHSSAILMQYDSSYHHQNLDHSEGPKNSQNPMVRLIPQKLRGKSLKRQICLRRLNPEHGQT